MLKHMRNLYVALVVDLFLWLLTNHHLRLYYMIQAIISSFDTPWLKICFILDISFVKSYGILILTGISYVLHILNLWIFRQCSSIIKNINKIYWLRFKITLPISWFLCIATLLDNSRPISWNIASHHDLSTNLFNIFIALEWSKILLLKLHDIHLA